MHGVFLKMANPVGIVGVILILIAYLLLSMERMRADTFWYQALNFIGAWMILFSLYFYWNLSSVLIEIAWIIISMIGLYRWYVSQPK